MVLPTDKDTPKPEDEEIIEGEEEQPEEQEEAPASGAKPAAEQEEEDDGDPEESTGTASRKSPRYQRRIDELTRARHEMERQLSEAVNYARGVVEENKALKQRNFSTSEVAASEGTARAESELARAKQEMKEAHELGDYDKIAEIQERIADAVLDKKRLSEATARLRAEREHAGKAPQELQVPQFPQAQPAEDPKLQAWKRKNTWFQNDPVMTQAALAMHMQLVRSGVDGASDEYYAQIDKGMREYFPNKFTAAKAAAQQPVAPAHRAAGGSQKKSALELTDSQKAIARKLGLSEDQYREGLRKMQANG